MTLYIYPYMAGSASVTALKKSLKVKAVRKEGSAFKGGSDKTVLNWGSSNLPDSMEGSRIINRPECVKIASNKLSFFNRVGEFGVNLPEYTTSAYEARVWSDSGKIVLARTKLNGHSGDGIFVISSLAEFILFDHTEVAVYVKYVPKKEEYRVHVFNGEVIDLQRKAARSGSEMKINYRIRSHANGFIFMRNNIEVPDQVSEQALKAISATGLDFGAVDIIWNEYYQKAYVLEVNTAPGLEGTTLINYSKAIINLGFNDKFTEHLSSSLKSYEESNVITDTDLTPDPTAFDWGVDLEKKLSKKPNQGHIIDSAFMLNELISN